MRILLKKIDDNKIGFRGLAGLKLRHSRGEKTIRRRPGPVGVYKKIEEKCLCVSHGLVPGCRSKKDKGVKKEGVP